MGQLMSDVQLVAANSVTGNVLTGKLGETLDRPSVVRLYVTGSAPGLLATFLVGKETFCQDQEVSAADRYPLIPDDFTVDAVGGVGEQVFLTLRNSTGAGITGRTRVDIIPAG